MCSQNALRFYDDVAYDDDYQGLALDAGEGDRICRQMGDKRMLFLANHGVVVVGPSIAAAFDDLYYLERACQVQVLAQVDPSSVENRRGRSANGRWSNSDRISRSPNSHLAAIRRILDRESPDYADDIRPFHGILRHAAFHMTPMFRSPLSTAKPWRYSDTATRAALRR